MATASTIGLMQDLRIFGGVAAGSPPRILHIGFFAAHEVQARSGIQPDILEVHLVGLVHGVVLHLL
ncbi:MAG: hypothetical protein J0H31_16125, partial [Alphaproteobacteria bacterium]|nr:hypothetical protein [Alphaproteobacteria bacterium]